MCGVGGQKKQSRLVRGAHASIASQPSAHGVLKVKQPAAHGGQQVDHSHAAETGGIQMHVGGREKVNKAGRSEGHMPA